MNRRPAPKLQLVENLPNKMAEDNPPNDFSPGFNQQPIIRMRCREPSRTDADGPLTPRRLRRSPFASTPSGTSTQRPLDNHRDGPAFGSHRRNVLSGHPYTPATSNPPRPNVSVGDFEEIREKLVQAKLLVERANTLLDSRSNVRYRVALQVPIHYLNQAKREHRQLQCEPIIEMQCGGVRKRSISIARMQYNLRELEANRDINEDGDVSVNTVLNLTNEAKKPLTRQPDFLSLNGDLVLVGVANLYLRCLLFISEFSYQTPILNPQGEVSGRLHVQLSTVIRSESSNSGQLVEIPKTPDLLDRELCDFGGNVVEVTVAISEATGIPNSFTKKILCHYQMLGVDEPTVVLPKLESFASQTPPDPTTREYERTQRCIFGHTRVYRLPLTRQTLNSLANYPLSVEVYGNLEEPQVKTRLRRMTSNRTQMCLNSTRQPVDQLPQPQHHGASSPSRMRTTKLRRYKSDIADRRKIGLQGSQALTALASPMNGLSNEVASRLAEEWLRVQRRVDFWVAIEELMEDGSFKKVSVIPASDVKTGGIYQLRQGLNRRIRVLIRPNELSRKERGVLPLLCDTVSKVSVGCVTRSFADFENGQSNYGRNRAAPDSYQEYDLEMVRHKWCNAMDEWQSYLQKNLQILAKKRQRDSADEAKEGYLLNRWVSSIQERDAILVPPAGSSLPGAPAIETPPPGLEEHTPLIFVNPEDGASNKPAKAGAHSYLEGEEACLKEGEAFVTLPLIKTYATLIGALASWDSNLHKSDLLNKITPSTERIYLIVKAHIVVRKPAPLTLVLRKRICVKIRRRNDLATIFKSPFSRMVSAEKEDMLWTGVAYQFVAGIPQMMPYSPNSGPVEVGKEEATSSESFAAQYMRTLQSVSSELYLDGLRQEVALREALATNQHLRQPFNLANLGLAIYESDLVEAGLSRSRSFTDRSTRLVWSEALRQRSQSRQKPSLYPHLSVPRGDGETQPGSPLSIPVQDDALLMQSLVTETTDCYHQAVDLFRTSTVSSVAKSPACEEQMAWSRRDREKQKSAN